MSAPEQRRRPAISELKQNSVAERVLDARGISKRFGRVQALAGVDMDVRAGSVLALLGDNGAGKSTLVKIIAGVHQPDSGEISVTGETVRIASPRHASEFGIETVYQDLALCDNLNVVQNLFLGRERRRGRNPIGRLFLNRRAMESEAGKAFGILGVRIPDFRSQVSTLSGGQRQAVAIARAIVWKSRIVMFDEPTAALGVEQTENVHCLIRRLRDQGVGVVLITHNMIDVFALADRLIVLRRGRRIAEMDPAQCSPNDVVAAITGSAKSGASMP